MTERACGPGHGPDARPEADPDPGAAYHPCRGILARQLHEDVVMHILLTDLQLAEVTAVTSK